MRRTLTPLTFAILILAPVQADEVLYQKPPKEVLEILNAPATPMLAVNPTKTYASLSQAARYPSIAEVSEPMLRLAGMRIDPRTNGLHLAPHSLSVELVKLPEGTKTRLALPPNAQAGPLRWSPDGKQFAFSNTVANGIELWLGDPVTGKTHKVAAVKLNAVNGDPIDWMPDNKTIIVKTVPAGRGPAPAEPRVPKGPHVQESDGNAGGVATYEDLLQNPHDEELYEYYATAQLVSIDTASGKVTPLGKPGISTDGKYMLITREHRPFSYLHPAREFPKEVEIWNQAGVMVHKVASVPTPKTASRGGGVQPGPRQFRWMPNEPASLMYVEALDGGNPREKVPNRDSVLALRAPFNGEPSEIVKTQERFSGMQFGKDFALVEDSARITRIVRTFKIDPAKPATEAKLIWSRNSQDRYKDPGTPVSTAGGGGGRGGGGGGRGGGGNGKIVQSGDSILLEGAGASPTGDHPFLDRFNLNTLRSERIFQSSPDVYEVVSPQRRESHGADVVQRSCAAAPPHHQATGDLQARRRCSPLDGALPASRLQTGHETSRRSVGLSARV